MSCADCLHAILDAEPAELRGYGTSGLAEHLRGCPSCRNAAGAILDDTRALAGVVRADARLRASAHRRFAIAALAAAGIIFAVAARMAGVSDTHPAETLATPRPAPKVAAAPPRDTATIVTEHSEPSTRVAASSEVRPERRRLDAVAIQATAFEAVPIRPAEAERPAEPEPIVSVRPQGGRRAAVFRVAQSKVTLVWLY